MQKEQDDSKRFVLGQAIGRILLLPSFCIHHSSFCISSSSPQRTEHRPPRLARQRRLCEGCQRVFSGGGNIPRGEGSPGPVLVVVEFCVLHPRGGDVLRWR